MQNSEQQLGQTESAQATASFATTRWIVAGTGALIGITMLGGALVSIFQGRTMDSLGATALLGLPAGIYNLLVVAPLATAAALTLAIGAPAVTRLSNHGTSRVRVMAIAAAITITATVPVWYLTGIAAQIVSRWVAERVYEVNYGTFDHYFLALLPEHTELWSLIETLILALVLLTVLMVAAVRDSTADGSARIRQALITGAGIGVVFGVLFAVNAMRVFDGLGMTVHGG